MDLPDEWIIMKDASKQKMKILLQEIE